MYDVRFDDVRFTIEITVFTIGRCTIGITIFRALLVIYAPPQRLAAYEVIPIVHRKSPNRKSNQFSRVRNHPRHRSGGSYQRTGEQSAGTRSLSSFEVTVAGGHCILAGRHFVIIHRQAR